MNHPTRTIGDSTSVASRFGSTSGIVRPEKLLDVLCYNSTGGTLFMQVFEVTPCLIPFGTKYSGGGSYTLTGLTPGHTYAYALNQFGSTDTQFTNNAVVYTTSGTFVAAATTCVFTGTASALVSTLIVDLSVPQQTPAPAAGSTAKFSVPVQSLLGGTLGRPVDMAGIFCAWSSTQATYTAAGASGSINIVVKG